MIRRRADRMSDKGAAGTGVEGEPMEPLAGDRSIDREEALLDGGRCGPRWPGGGRCGGVIAQVAQQLLSVGATVILARLLTPSDFGIITASITVLQFAQMTMALGWQAAIVRRRDADGEYLSSIFWVVSPAWELLLAAIHRAPGHRCWPAWSVYPTLLPTSGSWGSSAFPARRWLCRWGFCSGVCSCGR